MRHLLILFIFAAVCACAERESRAVSTYPSKGWILLFDTTLQEYRVSSKEQALIRSWEAFRQALPKADTNSLVGLSAAAIYCPTCLPDGRHPLVSADIFYRLYVRRIFDSTLLRSMMDSTKVSCRYEENGWYLRADSSLLLVSGLEQPKAFEFLVQLPLRKGEREGTTVCLGFIETKEGYKFCSVTTIP